MVDVFGSKEFEKALTDSLEGTDLQWFNTGYLHSELHYSIPVKSFEDDAGVQGIGIEINSSIKEDGLSAGSGEDSIRAWLTNEEGYPIGNKIQRWVTRQPGWEGRLTKVISKLIEMAQSVEICPTCGMMQNVWVVKKDGPNKGRFFRKCDAGCAFIWIDEVDDETPNCPKCQQPMVKRNGKYGEFWGCRRFPDCRGTRQIDDDGSDDEPVSNEPSNEPSKEERQKALRDKINKTILQDEQPIIEKKGFAPSKYQQAIFDWVTTGIKGQHGRNLVVEAVAGSGKTTTGVKMLEMVPRDKKVLFVAFNRHIAKELAKRAPRHVRVTTYHSLGYKAIRMTQNGVEVDNKKVDRILDNYLDKKIHGYLIPPIKQLVSLVKANLSGVSAEELQQLADYYGIVLNGEEAFVFQAVEYVIAKSVDMTSIVDFDDMCYLPVYFNMKMEAYDFIFIDEAQDTNRNQIALAMACCHENTRIVACGDRYQSLYGFRGADVDAIPNLIDSLQAETLPLSITYRNPKSIVEFVNNAFPHIPLEAPNWAQEGHIEDMSYNMALAQMESGDMALCRNNAPLVRPAFALIRDGKKAVIMGRDIGRGLISLIRKMEVSSVLDLMAKLSEYEEKEVAKLLEARKTNQAQILQDKVDTIIAISDMCEYVYEVEAKIEQVFSDEVEGIVFSTVHRAKGLEADNVYILNPELMPSRHAEQPWELQQEENIQYVAYTRAMSRLVFVRE